MDQQIGFRESQVHDVLIVDDDQEMCKLLETLFQTNGYTARVAHTGQEAVKYVQANQPDVVVLDILMSETIGRETFAKIVSQSEIPVLFLTALTSGNSAAHTINLEGHNFMHQPFSYEELLTRIELLMENAKPKYIKHSLSSYQQVFNRNIPITVVIPAYNEARFIGSTVLKASEYADKVIVVDDGSSDNTAEIAEEAGALLVQHPCNQGKAAALNTGFCKARELAAQVVVTLDADGQHLPEDLAQVVMPVITGEADIVIGSRYLEHHSDVPRSRIWGHWFFNRLTHIASGIASTDSQSGYRAFSPAALEAISFCSKGFTVESEMQFIAHEKGLRLKEVPITIRYTDKPKRSVIKQGMSVLGGVFKLVGQYRPLFYFGLPGFIAIIFGLIWGWVVVERYEVTHQLAIGYALISLLLIIIGVSLFSTGFTLHSIRGLLTDLFRSNKKSDS